MPVHSPVRSCDWPVQNSPLYTRFTHNFPEPQGEDLQDRPPPHIHHQGTARNATGCHKKKHRKTKKKISKKVRQSLSMLLSLTFLSRLRFAFGWSKSLPSGNRATAWRKLLRILPILIQPTTLCLSVCGFLWMKFTGTKQSALSRTVC